MTDGHTGKIGEAVGSEDYALSSGAIRDALRDCRAKRVIEALWDEKISSGLIDPDETIGDIKAAARSLQES